MRIVAIQNYGSSGTLLVQSLLDDHPNILSTPALYSRYFYFFWERYGLCGRDALIDAFMREHDYWFTPDSARARKWGLDQMGEEMKGQTYVSAEKFRAAFATRLAGGTPSRAQFLSATYRAYADALGRTVQEPALIVYPIHSMPMRIAKLFMEDFPEAKFLYTVREPLPNIGSSMKHMLHSGIAKHPFESALSQILCDRLRYGLPSEGVYQSYGAEPYLSNERTRAIRLEDMHKKSEATLRAVCQWLAIPWNSALLTSTFDGQKWWNRPSSPRLSGFGITTITQKYGFVNSRFDTWRLRVLALPKYRAWEYDNTTPSLLTRFTLAPLLLAPFAAEWKVVKSRFVFLAHHLKKKFTAWAVRWTPQFIRPFVKVLGVMLVAPALVIGIPLLLIRDYLAIRFWLYRAWLDGFRKERKEVELLPLA